MYRRLRLCSNRGGYEAVAEPPHPIDLAAAKTRLEAAGIPVVDARVMLIASLEADVTISRAGRLLFKTHDVDEAERAFARVRSILGLPGMAGERSTELPGG